MRFPFRVPSRHIYARKGAFSQHLCFQQQSVQPLRPATAPPSSSANFIASREVAGLAALVTSSTLMPFSSDASMQPFYSLAFASFHSRGSPARMITAEGCHALFFAAAAQGCGAYQSRDEAALFSGASVEGFLCMQDVAAMLDEEVCDDIDDVCSAAHVVFESPSPLVRQALRSHWKVTSLTLAELPARQAQGSSHVGTSSRSHADKLEQRQILLTKTLRDLTGVLPDHVLINLLSSGSADPSLLAVLVRYALSPPYTCGHATCAAGAHSFTLLMTSLLRNDQFFHPATFVAMNSLLKVVIAAAATAGEDFDYVSVRWTPIMNTLSRVYTRCGAGRALCDLFDALSLACPAAVEIKTPASFYVRLLGALVDVYSAPGDRADTLTVAAAAAPPYGDGDMSAEGWQSVTRVSKIAIRLFGRAPQDMRVLWVLLLKAALTFASMQAVSRRLLEAYHLCAELGYPMCRERHAFSQVLRFTSASVSEQGQLSAAANEEERAEVMRLFSQFVQEQSNLSFLWVMDGVGQVLATLHEAHATMTDSAKIQAEVQAATLSSTLQSVLDARGAAGVRLEENPLIAQALEGLHVGCRPDFWWNCGCGARLPAASKRCLQCLRGEGSGGMRASWVCFGCSAQHKEPCWVQGCDCCGIDNPRLAAALQCECGICAGCGAVVAAGRGACPHCNGRRICTRHGYAAGDTHTKVSELQLVCRECGAACTSDAYYCRSCFAIQPRGELVALQMWHCEKCGSLALSTSSSCADCGASRRTGCATVPYSTWRCGCGGYNFPTRLSCRLCIGAKGGSNTHSTHARGGAVAYTCPECKTTLPLDSTVVVHVPLKEDRGSDTDYCVHLCPRCHTAHPRDTLIINSITLHHRCMLCATAVTCGPDALADSAAGNRYTRYHCGAWQQLNERVPFRCTCDACKGSSEWQAGYDCHYCHRPRPEMQDTPEDSLPLPFYVWRCMNESEGGSTGDFNCCGQWNYSWSPRCLTCGVGRRVSRYECQAKAVQWRCRRCGGDNRPIDVLLCSHCGEGVQPVPECHVCGTCHFTYACSA